MLDDDQIACPATRALVALLDRLGEISIEEARAIAAASWEGCSHGSMALAIAERFAPRAAFLRAAAACARYALQARSSASPVLENTLAIVEACARGDAGIEDAKRASNAAMCTVSRMVAGIDDDVGLAASEASDLAAGAAFEFMGPDPAGRAAWAMAWRRFEEHHRGTPEDEDRACHAELAAIVRAVRRPVGPGCDIVPRALRSALSAAESAR